MEPRHEMSLKEEVQNLQQESRMILPGIQALFGFQLIAVFNDRFAEDLLQKDQILHLVAIVFTITAIILTIAPAAFHREAEPTFLSKDFVKMFNRCLCRALLPLAAAISLDVYIIAKLIIKETPTAVAIGALSYAAFIFAWYIRPRFQKTNAGQSRL